MILNQATHGILATPTLETAKAENCYAVFTVCFGPGNESYLTGLRFVKGSDGQMGWESPQWIVERNGKRQSVSLYGGALMKELSQMAAKALERIKEERGSSAWNTRYYIYKDRIEAEEKK